MDMRDERSVEFISKINENRQLLPDLRLLSFRFIGEDDVEIQNLLTNSVVHIQSLFFNNHVLPKYRLKKIDIGNYMEWIINILPKVTKDVYLYYFKINGRQLARYLSYPNPFSIIKNGSHLHRIGFIKSKINITTSSLDFSKPGKIRIFL